MNNSIKNDIAKMNALFVMLPAQGRDKLMLILHTLAAVHGVEDLDKLVQETGAETQV